MLRDSRRTFLASFMLYVSNGRFFPEESCHEEVSVYPHLDASR